MKVLIGTKILSLKDCIGYGKVYNDSQKKFMYFLIYERFDKISLVNIYMYGDFSDIDFYKIKYVDIQKYIKEKNMETNDDQKICFHCSKFYNFPFVCENWSHNYFRFDCKM